MNKDKFEIFKAYCVNHSGHVCPDTDLIKRDDHYKLVRGLSQNHRLLGYSKKPELTYENVDFFGDEGRVCIDLVALSRLEGIILADIFTGQDRGEVNFKLKQAYETVVNCFQLSPRLLKVRLKGKGYEGISVEPPMSHLLRLAKPARTSLEDNN